MLWSLCAKRIAVSRASPSQCPGFCNDEPVPASTVPCHTSLASSARTIFRAAWSENDLPRSIFIGSWLLRT